MHYRSLPHLPNVGARYLQIVLHAQREIARLSGLYDLPASIHDPDAAAGAGRPMQIVIRRDPNLPREQLVAWTAFRAQWDAAHPDHPVPPDDLVFPPDGAPLHDYAIPDDLDGDDDPDDDRPGLDAAASDTPDRLSTCPDEEYAADPACATDPQPAQAGLVAARPLGANSSAAARVTAAETASLSPSSPASADPAITNPIETPPTVVHPGAPIPPALLPRFRSRSNPPSLPTFRPVPVAALPLAPQGERAGG